MNLKSRLQSIFDVHSRRTASSSKEHQEEPLTDEMRTRLLLLYRDVLSGRWSNHFDPDDYTRRFWDHMHNTLQHLHGRPKLSQANTRDPGEDTVQFLYDCHTGNFLDFLELSFKLDISAAVFDNDVVQAINEVFRLESSPYRLTKIIGLNQDGTTYLPNPFADRILYPQTVTALPRVFLVDDEIVDQEAIQPALSVLGAPYFKAANNEFLNALNDYRVGEFSDCLTKCGSALESVMKVTCARNRWSYSESDTAGPLLKTIIDNSDLGAFFEQPLMVIATIRNRLSSSHGAGSQPRTVARHIAQYVVTSTAAAIVLIVEETI